MGIVFYTCVTHGYDSFVPKPASQGLSAKFVCFTNDVSLHASGWEIRSLASPVDLVRADHINRWHKFFAHDIFPDADVSIYIDGNVAISADWSDLIVSFVKSGAGFSCFFHSQRDSVYQEMEACRIQGKFKHGDEVLCVAQLEAYKALGFPGDSRLLAATVLFRRHGSSLLREAMSLWWEQVNSYTCRDQLSLPFVLWKTGLPFFGMKLDVLRSNIYMFRVPHKCSNVDFLLRRLRNRVRSLWARGLRGRLLS